MANSNSAIIRYRDNEGENKCLLIKNENGDFLDAPIIHLARVTADGRLHAMDVVNMPYHIHYLNLVNIQQVIFIRDGFMISNMEQWQNYPVIGHTVFDLARVIIMYNRQVVNTYAFRHITNKEIRNFIANTIRNQQLIIQQNHGLRNTRNRLNGSRGGRPIWNTVNVYRAVNNFRNVTYCYVTGERSFADDRDHLLAMSIMELLLFRYPNDLNNESLEKICNFVHCLKTEYHRNFKSSITDGIFRNITRRMLYEDDEITEEEIFKMHVVKFEEKKNDIENDEDRNIYIQHLRVYCKTLPCLISYFLNIINAWKSIDGVITFEQIYPVTVLHFEGFVNACKFLHSHERNVKNIEDMLINLRIENV